MRSVAALYRYPLKGFTPETCEVLSILADGRVQGDRVLGLRFANTDAPDDAWSRKTGMLALVNTPGLARLTVRFDHQRGWLNIWLGSEPLVGAGLDRTGRRDIAQAIAQYVLTLDDNPLADHPERLPLRLVGDGGTPRHHDSEAGEVTLHGRTSLSTLGAALGDSRLSELRFRSNIAVDGLEAWEELGWIGRKVRVGAVRFQVIRVKTRCLATHANPRTGQRDHTVLTTLTNAFGHEKPTFAVAMLPTDGPGQIRVGDEVALID
jgi:uncharacterized protein YcbX